MKLWRLGRTGLKVTELGIGTMTFGNQCDEPTSRRHILAAVEASLRRQQTDSIDLYYAHSPDPETPLDETLDAFDTLVRHGKVHYLGASNYQAWLLARPRSEERRVGKECRL